MLPHPGIGYYITLYLHYNSVCCEAFHTNTTNTQIDSVPNTSSTQYPDSLYPSPMTFRFFFQSFSLTFSHSIRGRTAFCLALRGGYKAQSFVILSNLIENVLKSPPPPKKKQSYEYLGYSEKTINIFHLVGILYCFEHLSNRTLLFIFEVL